MFVIRERLYAHPVVRSDHTLYFGECWEVKSLLVSATFTNEQRFRSVCPTMDQDGVWAS